MLSRIAFRTASSSEAPPFRARRYDFSALAPSQKVAELVGADADAGDLDRGARRHPADRVERRGLAVEPPAPVGRLLVGVGGSTLDDSGLHGPQLDTGDDRELEPAVNRLGDVGARVLAAAGVDTR